MKTRKFSSRISITILAFVAAMFLIVLAFAAPKEDDELTVKHPKFRDAVAVQDEVTPDLMSDEDILGTAVGLDDEGEATLIVFVNLEGKNPARTYKAVPRNIKGVRASVVVTEPFRIIRAMPAAAAVSQTLKQTPPIQLGTSGSWRYELANGYCCSGTLGALVQIGGAQYILSNYHVFRGDIVAGGNGRVATNGDPVIQPGLIDVGCIAGQAQDVALLAGTSSLPNSNVDAAIAQVIPGMVDPSGAILEIGTISKTPVAASIFQAVKKSGRTTGLTRSRVVGINGTISVQYENECAGGVAFTKTFKRQIMIANTRAFISGGDSGSLAVQDIATNPKPVGLLFAGNSLYAIANPISEVLAYLGATMVGK